MNIVVTNTRRWRRIDRAGLTRLTAWLMEKASAMDRGKTWIECSVVLVGHARMISLNEQSLGHEGTTDVITFAYPTLPGEPRGWRGEIFVNLDEAEEAGAKYNSLLDRELALYIAHGCQHLGGADDDTTTGRAAMNRRQNRWLREAARLGLIRKLIR
jgi:rRNA maturation RNase YbeY